MKHDEMDRRAISGASSLPNAADAGLRRRTLVGGAVFAVPAVMATVSTPAYAASPGNSISVGVSPATLKAGGATTVTATVTTGSGAASSGQSVSFQLPASSGLSLGQVSGVTDSSGKFSTSLTASTSANFGARTVTAVSNGQSATGTLWVTNTNVYGIGVNAQGQLGDGSPATTRSSWTVTSRIFPAAVKQIATGDEHTLFLLADGTVWAVGSNGGGQLGNGTTNASTVPAQVPGLSGVDSIAAGAYTSYALRSGGDLWGWGLNNYGQIGDNTTTTRLSPTNTGLGGGSIIAACANSAYFYSAGNVFAWASTWLGTA